MRQHILEELRTIASLFQSLPTLAPEMERVAELCVNALRAGNKILFCGNGGSAADSQHLAAELVGRYKLDRPAMNALALTVDTSILTALGNDYGFETIFARQVQGLGRAGDVLFGLSTSGNSRNIILAFQMARRMDMRTVALTGQSGGLMRDEADFRLCVPSAVTNHIQEMHIAVGHILCDLMERALYGSDGVSH